MSILNVMLNPVGLEGVRPRIVYIETDDTLATVTAAGYLNEAYQQGYFFQETDWALVAVRATPSAAPNVVQLDVNKSGDDWSLVAASSSISLPSAQILVGNAAGVATAVAMSGDVAINNTGATTIQAGAIDLAMLSTGIAPSHVIKFANQVTTAGGAAAEAITVTGAAATDLAFVQVVNDGTANVTVLQAVVTLNTLTVTFSADPGNDTVINYQIIRAAA